MFPLMYPRGYSDFYCSHKYKDTRKWLDKSEVYRVKLKYHKHIKFDHQSDIVVILYNKLFDINLTMNMDACIF